LPGVYLLVLAGFASPASIIAQSPKNQPAIADVGDFPIATSADARYRSWQQHQRMNVQSPFRELVWSPIGPRKQGGRIEAIACDPKNPSTMYVAPGSGGVWKTTNRGITWTPIFTSQATNAIGDIAVSESNPSVIWVGTGEVLMTPRSTEPGMGVYQSTDAGETWQQKGLLDSHHIGRLRIHPQDPNTVFVAVIGHLSTPNEQRGVFKTTDGGESWKRVLYLNAETSAIDLVLDSKDPSTLYATMWQRALHGADHYGASSGIYMSRDSGESWKRLTNGIPVGDKVGRIAIDVSKSNSNIVYALVDHKDGDGLYRSEDKGESWNQVNQQPVRGSWDWCEIQISPDNQDEVYNIGQTSFVSRDGGKTFSEIGGKIVRLQPHISKVLHLDTHCIWINPKDPNHILFGNDGGLYLSYDRAENWLHLNNLPIAEVYAMTYDSDEPYNIYIGTQDNAALYGPSTHVPEDGSLDWWTQIYIDRWGGGDAYFTFRDTEDKDIIYYESQYGGLRRHRMSTMQSRGIRPAPPGGAPGLRFAWMTPYMQSKHSVGSLYCAANHVFKSKNRGDDWEAISPDLTLGTDQPNLLYKAITALEESPHTPGTLYAGSDNGNVFSTTTDGGDWEQLDAGLPDLDVTRISCSPHQAERVFLSMSGMRFDDFSAYLYRSDNAGKTWNSIAEGLPLEPINVVREDPVCENVLYVGTDLGVYCSVDSGKNWASLCNNLPTVAVHDLFAHPTKDELVVGTHGLSVFKMDISKLREQ
ncbi:MAG: hypothetical protein AAF483_20090, partial [Planctomycetota bacterium]